MSLRRLSIIVPALALAGGAAFLQAQRPTRVDDAALRNAAQSKGEDWLS